MSMFFVRTAGPRDLDKIRALLAEADVEAIDATSLKASLEKRAGEFLVADDGRVLGGLAYAYLSETLARTVSLDALFVAEPFRRRGVGRDLFAEMETCFPGAEIMRLVIAADNEAAYAFFASHGFIEVDRSGVPGSERLVLEKPLSNTA